MSQHSRHLTAGELRTERLRLAREMVGLVHDDELPAPLHQTVQHVVALLDEVLQMARRLP